MVLFSSIDIVKIAFNFDDLHSIMVLFSSLDKQTIKNYLVSFTFHYGSIFMILPSTKAPLMP